jgi:hypothetical protein
LVINIELLGLRQGYTKIDLKSLKAAYYVSAVLILLVEWIGAFLSEMVVAIIVSDS